MSKFMQITITDSGDGKTCDFKVFVSASMDKATANKMVDTTYEKLRKLTKTKINKLPIRERDTA